MRAALRSIDVPTRVGLIAVAVLYLALAVFQASTLRIEGAADTYGHMDYIYQLSQGHLPDGYGYELKAGSSRGPNANHLTAQHPPLYYVLMLGLTWPFWQTGDWEAATVVTRIANITFGLAIAAVLSWAAWRLGGALRRQLAIVVPAMGVLMVPFMRVAADSYNDVFATLTSTLALAVVLVMLRHGPTRRLQIVLAVTCVIGMATRSTFIVSLAIALAGLAVAHLVHRRDRPLRARIGGFIGWWAGILGTVVVSIGWFYLLNIERSGYWYRARPKAPILNRDEQTTLDVLMNPDYYLVIANRLLGFRDWAGIFDHGRELSFAISLICAIGVAWWLLRGGRLRRVLGDPTRWTVVAFAAVNVVGFFLEQLTHATGWGNINPRYLLPTMLVTAFVLGIGSLAWRRLRGLLAVAIIGVLGLGTMIEMIWFMSLAGRDAFNPPMILTTAGIGAAAGVTILVVLWRLTSRDAVAADAAREAADRASVGVTR
jgi:hypothetical protein